MKVAIYSRKSKFTGKGDSIENQIQLCKEYANNHFDNVKDFLIYEDEGFSGGDAERPEYQRMMKDAQKGNFKALICYRLDRISRNVLDFSETIEILQNKEIDFISIREQFDTSSPMGRAMMFIASVFAQLERETIAERIRDNMLELAKTGRWLGGITPTGFASKELNILDSSGKERKMFKLTPIEEEIKIIKLIYEKFLELDSLTQLETYCIQNDIKTKNNKDYSRFALRNILNNPVYAMADADTYNHFINNDYDVYSTQSEFTGVKGIMAYNKTIQKKNTTNKLRDNAEWIIAVGKHPGIIKGKDWIKVQSMIEKNRSKSYRKVKNTQSLLSGLLKCHCGSFMRPRTGRINKDGIRVFYYMCEMKEKSRRQKCQSKNLNGNELDDLIIKELKKLAYEDSNLHHRLASDKINIENSQSSISTEIDILKNKLNDNEKSIANLVDSLAQGENSSAGKYIIKQINLLDEQAAQMKERLLTLQEKLEHSQTKDGSLNLIKDMLKAFSGAIDTLSISEKRNLLKGVIEKITWDDKSVNIMMFGADVAKKL